MKLKSKVLLAQAPLGLFIFIMCLLFIFTTGQIRKSTSDILQENYKNITALENMRIELDSIDNSLWSIASNHYESKAIVTKSIEVSIKNFAEQLENQSAVLENENKKDNTLILIDRWNNYKTAVENVLVRNPIALTYTDYSRDLKGPFTSVKEAINLVTELNQDEVFYRTESVNSTIRVVGQIIVVFTLATFLIGILASAMLTNKIMQPLTVLSRLVRDIANGKVGLKLDVSGNDEVSELGLEFNAMIKNLEEYRRSSLGEILNAKDFLKLSIDTLPDPVFVFNPQMQVLHYNIAATKTFGLRSDAVFLEDIAPNFRERIIEVIHYFISDPEATLPAALSKPIMLENDNSSIELIPVARTISASGVGLIGISILFRNITNIDLKGYIKAERVVTLTHELLSPLNSAQTAIHICLEKIIGDLNSRQVEFLSTARDDCFKVRRMVTNLQDLEKLDNLASAAPLQNISLEDVLAKATKELEVLAVTREVVLHSELTQSVGKVLGNEDQLVLAFKNILDNAILHTPKSGEISIRMKERENDFVCFIHNTGSYVPKEARDKIFDKYFTVQSDEFKGDGIGLHIAKQIVLQHKGEIGVKSSKKLGTTFWVKLPRS